jgi:hypothetical protein
MEKENSTNTINLDQIPLKNPKIQIRDESKGKYLLFNSENYEPMIINITGKTIWESCNGERNVKEIINIVKETFLMDKEKERNLDHLVFDFLLILCKKELITL